MKRVNPVFTFALLCAAWLALPHSQAAPQLETSATKFARGRYGMVATGSPYATSAAVQMLEAGGNAMDAAAAGPLALVGGDPANTSLRRRPPTLLPLSARGA